MGNVGSSPSPRGRRKRSAASAAEHGSGLPVDRYRSVVFLNTIRAERIRAGFATLMQLADDVADIPYIRLSKLERGEVFARAEEVQRIAQALETDPIRLVPDPDGEGFDPDTWASQREGPQPFDLADERSAVLLAAAVRKRRADDPALTIAAIEDRFGLAPVTLSRVENVLKAFERWNPATRAGIFGLLGVADADAMTQFLERSLAEGALDAMLATIPTRDERHAALRRRLRGLRAALSGMAPLAGGKPPPPPSPVSAPGTAPSVLRQPLPVHGSSLPDGTIAWTATHVDVEAPAVAGPRAFALRVGRPTLGAALPGSATVVVDPDRYPLPGGLACIRSGARFRLLAVTIDQHNVLRGYSIAPPFEVDFDALDPAHVGAIVAAYF